MSRRSGQPRGQPGQVIAEPIRPCVAQRADHGAHKQKRPLGSGRFALARTAMFWLRENFGL